MSRAEVVAPPPNGLPADALQKELAEAERALAEVQNGASTLLLDHPDEDEDNTKDPTLSPFVQLTQLNQTADELLLAKDVTSWLETFSSTEEAEQPSVVAEAEKLEGLAKLLRRHKPVSPLYDRLFQGEYVANFEYLRSMLIFSLRKTFRQVNYPSPEACAQLMDECESGGTGSSFQQIASCAKWLHRLQVEHDLLISYVHGTSPSSAQEDVVVLELCRPFVERIRFHFVLAAAAEQQQQKKDASASRIELLPEWLFSYIREHVFPEDQDGPWDLVRYGLTPVVRPDFSLDFVNEIIRLAQWVFAQRNFFRHPRIAGVRSQPMFMCNAVEQLLRFDDFMSNLTGRKSGRVLSLMDVYVAGDDELFQWWMEREREAGFDTLFNGKVEEGLMTQVSPRAELFCSLLRSIKRKATVFSFSGPYLNQVAAPLCMAFLDAVHDSAADLKDFFNQRRLPTVVALRTTVKEWIELINGTHMSAKLLVEDEQWELVDQEDVGEGVAPRSTAHEDMLRFGKSLERLEGVFVAEFASMFVENLVLEKAKLASYLMRCSHTLATEEEQNGEAMDMSPDLAEAQYLLDAFLESVEERAGSHASAMYASRNLRDRVLTLLSEHFLEVALDWHGTTPEVLRGGGVLFASDVNALFGDSLLPPAAMRLLDVAKCLAMETTHISVIGDALCGLAGQAPPLTEDMFAIDERVFDEAMSMVRAKNLVWLQLGDFLSVLNRRADLSHLSAF